MRHHNLPRALRKRVRMFYDSFWSRGVYYNEDRILQDLHFSLRHDVEFYLKRELIAAVPFFKDANPVFVAEVIKRLVPRFSQPDDLIIEAGSVGYGQASMVVCLFACLFVLFSLFSFWFLLFFFCF